MTGIERVERERRQARLAVLLVMHGDAMEEIRRLQRELEPTRDLEVNVGVAGTALQQLSEAFSGIMGQIGGGQVQ